MNEQHFTLWPTHRLYLVTGEGEDQHFHAIGGAWALPDEPGFSLLLRAFPTNGRCVMLPTSEDEADPTV